MSLKIQIAINEKINSLAGLGPFEDPRFHDAIQLATQGAQFGPQEMLGTFTSLVGRVVTIMSFLGILVSFNPFLTGLVVVTAMPELYVQIKMGHQRFSLAHEMTPKQRQVGYYNRVLSSLEFVKELRLFNLADHFLNSFRGISRELHQSQRNQQFREMRWQLVLNYFTNFVSIGAFIAVVLQAFAGRLSLGDVTLYTNAVRSVQGALSGLVFALANISESALFFTRYTELLALPQSIYICPSPQATPPLFLAIKLRNVSFHYSDEHPWVLRNVNLTIHAGQCGALVGLNGAGKTTLVKLLTRFYDPTAGRITWDGVDLHEFDPQDLRRRIEAIFQDFVRFDLTAHENVGLGDVVRMTENDRVHRAAEKAGVHETLAALPQGYQTTLSRWLVDNGTGVDLSGGEWQKIALARLFIRDADLMILDEPTAALDAQAEYDVYSRFVDLVAVKTSLLISHRFSTVRMADVIAVLEEG